MVVRASLEFRNARRICFLAAVDPHGKLAGVAAVCCWCGCRRSDIFVNSSLGSSGVGGD